MEAWGRRRRARGGEEARGLAGGGLEVEGGGDVALEVGMEARPHGSPPVLRWRWGEAGAARGRVKATHRRHAGVGGGGDLACSPANPRKKMREDLRN
jgi:hypothetical protein